MTFSSKLVGRLARLGPGTHTVSSELGLESKMRDGVVLVADRYFPSDLPDAPVILVRTPYGRGLINTVQAHVFAERGYQCVVQSCRGTFGSGGSFVPFVAEADDGADTLRWLREQPWCDGRIAMYGGSYVGYTQWSAAASGEPLAAVGLAVTASTMRDVMWPDGVFGLDVALTWAHLMRHQEEKWWQVLRSNARQRKELAPGFAHVPLVDDDRVGIGARSDIFQLFAASGDADANLWKAADRDPATLTAPASFTGGWYDIFLVSQLADFTQLATAGRQPSIVIGPWSHTSAGLLAASLRDNLAWYDTHLRGTSTRVAPAPVRVFLMGAKRWVDLPSWPPATTTQRLHLHPGGRLAAAEPPESPPDRHTYDPAHPTPSVGGPVLGFHAGPRDNRKLEARPDVLTYTSDPVTTPVTVLGSVAVRVHLHAEVPHIDVFARVCDVAPKGKSVNIADRIVRLGPDDFDAEGMAVVDLELSPTGHSFLPGHRVRLQITGGAHPRYARNLGTGEPATTATAMVPSTRQIFHDPAHLSWIDLPTFAG